MINLLKQKYQPQEQPRDPKEKPVIDTGVPFGGKHIPFLSVCIPTYNRSEMLPAAIESVLEQDFDDFELIICDNASTDNTEEVVRKYSDDRRLRYVRYKNLVSMYANHNRCVDSARAGWIVFLHSDDKLVPHALHTVKDLINRSDPRTSVIVSQANHIKERLNSWGAPWDKEQDLCYPEALDLFIISGGLSPSGTAYRKVKSFDTIAQFYEQTITSDHLYLMRELLEYNIIKWSGTKTVERLRHVNASSTVATRYGINWHSGYSLTYKQVSNHNNFQNYMGHLKGVFPSWPQEYQIIFLTRLAQANCTKTVKEFEKIANFKALIRSRAYGHVFLLKMNYTFYWKLLTFYKSLKFYFQHFALFFGLNKGGNKKYE
ncbi:glycosyltransferase family 2 protein [Kamptonema formosum]|uniref:glycosyltransferase family 2 protein n=1 Tax=Kamptonema formosum TaxID=331992 RepID=UPI00034ACAF0|nr:glycosyltransferase family A protein [Oscillatoria sp. PCC 10802]